MGQAGAGAKRVGGGDGAGKVEEMTGASGGRWALRRARAAVSERSAGRSVQPTIVFAWVGPWRTSQKRVTADGLSGRGGGPR